jgi:hypothetical protein
MQSNQAARCQHIHTSGAQCGSPALRNQKFCYYHQENRPQPYSLCFEGEWYDDPRLVMPVLEDAHSIQVVIRQIMQLLVQKRIEPKTAGLLLYASQIASSNLKRMGQEKPQPAQVVIDPDRVADTPLEMTPHSETAPSSAQASSAPANNRPSSRRKKDGPSEAQVQRDLNALVEMGKHLYDNEPVATPELDLARGIFYRARSYGLTPDAVEHERELAIEFAKRGENAPKKPASGKKSDSANDGLPPGTIQACERRPQYTN